MTSFNWQCPLCQEALKETKHDWRCHNKHAFDKAKEGYVNLLLPNQKNSKAPGDSPEMVLARRSFLNEGHYYPLAQAIAETIKGLTRNKMSASGIKPTSATPNIFDLGCGEGYYLYTIKAILHDELKAHYGGIDISKKAVQKAAKRNTNKQFAVASTFNLPLSDDSQDIAIQIFAPSKTSELARVLKTKAFWIWVNPHTEHLKELKHLVYDQPKLHNTELELPQGFELINKQILNYKINLAEPEQRANLLMMTPFYWSISQNKKDLLKRSLTDVTINFDIQLLQKK
ncbi:putative RNA methyltransferase [Glaciecola petra]|uniref:Methyltransferase domain-containing protein n=1 Tax=Glaciecola petra TaxID=3075602 RepID=A0ABU2ZT20_9ALTE|nr:methyltransferase domain-containing protein [Aestuariibacter sp. P117]MDT0595565.1 methyltransferase domain-containing protein [Aestuariibacter sp. P117]